MMIYSYNSKLSSHGIDTIIDYRQEFLEGIKRIQYIQEVGSNGFIELSYPTDIH